MYDYLFFTHLPSFYKVNLFNRLAERLKIYVVFVASSSSIRSSDFTSADINFEHEILHNGDFETRPRFINVVRLLNILYKRRFHKAVVGGWDLWEYWVVVFANNKVRNALVMESTIVESLTAGMKSKIKRIFVARIGTAFPSGRLHQQLLNVLGFKGMNYLTGGVGLFNRQNYVSIPQEFTSSFLYVGRLAREKNLNLLVEAFNELPHLKLTIVGSGPQERELKRDAGENIVFIPHVPNREIAGIYLSHNIFVLPSLREPWGLVVEEALYYGLPVVISRSAGCHTELVEDGQTGFKFNPDNKTELLDAIKSAAVPENYYRMRKNVGMIDFNKRDEEQIMAYVLGSQSKGQ